MFLLILLIAIFPATCIQWSGFSWTLEGILSRSSEISICVHLSYSVLSILNFFSNEVFSFTSSQKRPVGLAVIPYSCPGLQTHLAHSEALRSYSHLFLVSRELSSSVAWCPVSLQPLFPYFDCLLFLVVFKIKWKVKSGPWLPLGWKRKCLIFKASSSCVSVIPC